MSASFIGCKISLISKSEIRYEGILYTIDTKESTIALAKVRSFGTEDRVTDKPVAPRNEVYEYIIFRASDIKDLLVDDPPSSPGLTDPAIIQAQSGSGPPAPTTASYPTPAASKHQVPVAQAPSAPAAQKTTLSSVLASGAAPAPAQRKPQHPPSGHGDDRRAPGIIGVPQQPHQQQQHQQQPRVQPQHQQLQQQDRRPQHAGQPTGIRDNNREGREPRDTRDQGQRQQQGQFQQQQFQQRRDGHQQQQYQQNRNYGNPTGPRRVQSDWPVGGGGQARRDGPGGPGGPGLGPRVQGAPQNRPRMLDVRKLEEFDFEKANAEFEEMTKNVEDLKVTDAEKSSEKSGADANADGEAETYNKQKSFFDSISCEAIERQKGLNNRVDRRIERKMNQETFGVSHVYNNRNWGYRGGYRGGRGGGGGNYQNRGFNQNRGYNNNNNENRSFGNRNYNQNRGAGGGQGGGRGYYQNRNRDERPAARDPVAVADA